MSAVSETLRGLKKAELQTIHQFWLPGESVQYRADELRKRVTAALVRGAGVEERVARLSNSQRRLITAVLAKPKPRLFRNYRKPWPRAAHPGSRSNLPCASWSREVLFLARRSETDAVPRYWKSPRSSLTIWLGCWSSMEIRFPLLM